MFRGACSLSCELKSSEALLCALLSLQIHLQQDNYKLAEQSLEVGLSYNFEVSWLIFGVVGCLVWWLVGCLIVCLVSWLVWLVGCLIVWLVGWLVYCLFVWFSGGLVGWLVGCDCLVG